MAARCHELQTSADSIFVMTAICQRHMGEEIRLLRGRAFRRVRPGVKDDRLLASPEELIAVLDTEFGLQVPEVAALWPRICERHEQLFASAPA